MDIIAHKYQDNSIQLLSEHLRNVSIKMSHYAKEANLEPAHAEQISYLHDYGKASKEFQEYIRNDGSGKRISHSNIGGRKLYDAQDLIGSFCVFGCFSSSIFPHFRHSTSPLSSWEIPHFQQALSGYRFHNCVLPHKGMFHSVASSTSHQEMAVVSQSVNHGSGHLFIGEDAAPF